MSRKYYPLPIPESTEEYEKRLDDHFVENHRRNEYIRYDIGGYYRSRKMYYRKVQKIFFLVSKFENVLPIQSWVENKVGFPASKGVGENNKLSDPVLRHRKSIRWVLACIYKIAGSCLYMDRIQESLDHCNLIFDICLKYHPTYFSKDGYLGALKLTSSLFAFHKILEKDYEGAEKYVKMGLDIDSNSYIMKNTRTALDSYISGEVKSDFRSQKIKFKGIPRDVSSQEELFEFFESKEGYESTGECSTEKYSRLCKDYQLKEEDEYSCTPLRKYIERAFLLFHDDLEEERIDYLIRSGSDFKIVFGQDINFVNGIKLFFF